MAISSLLTRVICQPVSGVPPCVMPKPAVWAVGLGTSQNSGTTVWTFGDPEAGGRKRSATGWEPASSASGCHVMVYPAGMASVFGLTATVTPWTARATPGCRGPAPSVTPRSTATTERTAPPSTSAAACRLRLLAPIVATALSPSS
jgi:hypothetical protein